MSYDSGFVGNIPISLIVAADLNDCIGKEEELPWSLPSDLSWFREKTRGHACITGSKTQASIIKRIGGPLPGRNTVILTRSKNVDKADVHYAAYPLQALYRSRLIEKSVNSKTKNEEIFVIGGAETYRTLLPEVTRIYLTRVETVVNGDTFMPKDWLNDFILTGETGPHQGKGDEFAYIIQIFKRIPGRI
jgi:dihydrofolate reductase